MALLASINIIGIRRGDHAAWIQQNYAHALLPMSFWVFGNQTLCCALVTRALIKIPNDLSMSIAVAVLLGSFNVICLVYALSGIQRMLGGQLSCKELLVAFHGALFGA